MTGIINRIEYEFVLGTGFVNTVLPWIDDSKLMCAAQTAILVECNPQLSNTLRTITVQRDPANFVYEEIDTRDFSILNYSIVPIGDYTAFSLGSSVKNTNTRFLGAVKLFKSEGGSTNFLGYNTNDYILHDDIRDIKSALDNSNNEIIYIAHDGGVAVSNDNGQTFSDRSNGLQIANFYNLSISENDPDLIIGGVHDNSTFVLNFGEWYTTSTGDGFGQTLLIEEKYNRDEFAFLTNANYNMDRVTYNSDLCSAPPLLGTGYSGMARFVDKAESSNQMIYYSVDRNSSQIKKSINKGVTWTTMTINTVHSTEHISSFEVSDNNAVWVITTWGNNQHKIYLSSDYGVNFTEKSFPGNEGITDIEINKNGSDYDIWVTKGGFSWDGDRVWHTDDLGSSWTKVGGSTLGEYPVNTIAYDKVNNMLFCRYRQRGLLSR